MRDHDPEGRVASLKAGLVVSGFSLIWTVASGVAAATIGVLGGSLVLAAFGAIGLLDGIGSAALVVHFRHAVRHDTILESRERFTSLVVAAGMGLVGLATAAQSIHRLAVGSRAVSLPEGVALAAASAVVLAILAIGKRRIASRIPSRALLADSWLSAAGAALALVTVAGTGFTSTFGWWWADPATAAVVAGGAIAVAIRLAQVELKLLLANSSLNKSSSRLADRKVLMVNRSQALVLAFFAAVLMALVAIRILAPGVYSDALNLPYGASLVLVNSFVAGAIVLVVLVAVGVVFRWRWMFWLMVIAFVAGILRLPASMLEIYGFLPSTSPSWYLVLQAVIGITQFVIGLALIRGYRRAGPWGAF